jgi:hypothetical protein
MRFLSVLGAEAVSKKPVAQHTQRIISGRHPLKSLLDKRSVGGINFDQPGDFVVPIAKRGGRRIKTLLGLFEHSHLRLPGNVVGLLFCDRHFNIGHKNIFRRGV